MDLKSSPTGENILARHAEVVAKGRAEKNDLLSQRNVEHERALEREPMDLIGKLVGSRGEEIESFPLAFPQMDRVIRNNFKRGELFFPLKLETDDDTEVQLGLSASFSADTQNIPEAKSHVTLIIRTTDISGETVNYCFANVNLAHERSFKENTTPYYQHQWDKDKLLSDEDYTFACHVIREAAEIQGIETLPPVLPMKTLLGR